MARSSHIAVPALQLDIDGGDYVGGDEESTITGDREFILDVMATVNNTATEDQGGQLNTAEVLGNTFFVSIAILGIDTNDPSLLAGFGTLIVTDPAGNVHMLDGSTAVWGTPASDGRVTGNPEDIGKHDIFERFYFELEFPFVGTETCGTYNTQTDGNMGVDYSGTGSGYRSFDIDMTGGSPKASISALMPIR